ncbi:M20 family metallopeptidase [Candidatus Woesearchaeota archaeon]|nr:M20 family metallopeptidase [Candidatus Woesearchaeota archaeon]
MSDHIDDKETLKEIVGLASQLISYRTTEDKIEELGKCMDFIQSYFEGPDFFVKRFESKQRPILWVAFNKRKKQKVILNCHMDVVEGQSTQFNAEVKEGKLFGRGSSDMKGAVAIFMHLMKHFSRMKKKPGIGLMVVADEEIGGHDGTKYLIRKGYRSDFGLTGETSKGNIEVKHKGSLQVLLKAYGRASHGSRPWLGRNAIDILIRQYQKIMDEIPQAKNNNQWLPTVNVTNFISQNPPNVTPSKAEMILDIRTTPDFDSKKVLAVLRKNKIRYKKLLEADILDTKPRNKHVQELRKIATRRIGRRVKLIRSSGGSDTRFFYKRGIPAVNFGPSGKGHHTTKEYLELKSVMPYYLTVHDFITKSA